MQFLPIADRELRVASRQPRTHRLRLIAAAVGIAIGAYAFWVIFRVAGIGGAGREVFNTLVHLAFIYCLFAGVSSTADCLSREKREGTMGLLFLTDLRSYEIVIGKLAAASLHVIYGLLATVPVFSIILVVGGVQAGEFSRIVLALFNTAFLSLSIGLFVSAASWEERRAAQTASGIVVVFGFVLPALGEYLRTKTNAIELGVFLTALSPALTLNLGSIPTSSAKMFWWSLLAVHLLAWASLAFACWILPRSWKDRPATDRMSWRPRWEHWLAGDDARRRASRRPLLDGNPFFWLATRSRLVICETLLLICAAILLAAWAAWYFRSTLSPFIICVLLAITLHCIGKMQVCSAACDRLAQDKHSGVLETLLGTPLRISEIVRGQLLGVMRQFAGVITAVILLDFLMLILVLAFGGDEFAGAPDALANSVLFVGAGVVMLVIDAVTLGWVGMWQAVTARTAQHARGKALFYVLIMPWLLLIIGVTYVAVRQPEGVNTFHFLSAWFAVGVVNSVIFALVARRRLFSCLRVFATDRFQPKQTSWFDRKDIAPSHSLGDGARASA